MVSRAAEMERKDDSFWRGFPAVADYFGPAIVPLLRYLHLDPREVMHDFGDQLGRRAAARMGSLSINQMLDEFAKVWQGYRIGSLTVEGRDPLVLQISNCTVCGQLQGTGEIFECAFHEGLFKGALGERLGRPVTVRQETNYEGDAGTWCRQLAASETK